MTAATKPPGLDELEALRVRLSGWADADIIGSRDHLVRLVDDGLAAIKRAQLAGDDAVECVVDVPEGFRESDRPETNIDLGDAEVSACLVLGDVVAVAPSLDAPAKVCAIVAEAASGRPVWLYFDNQVALKLRRRFGELVGAAPSQLPCLDAFHAMRARLLEWSEADLARSREHLVRLVDDGIAIIKRQRLDGITDDQVERARHAYIERDGGVGDRHEMRSALDAASFAAEESAPIAEEVIRAVRREARICRDQEVARCCSAALGLPTGDGAGGLLDARTCRARLPHVAAAYLGPSRPNETARRRPLLRLPAPATIAERESELIGASMAIGRIAETAAWATREFTERLVRVHGGPLHELTIGELLDVMQEQRMEDLAADVWRGPTRRWAVTIEWYGGGSEPQRRIVEAPTASLADALVTSSALGTGWRVAHIDPAGPDDQVEAVAKLAPSPATGGAQ